MKKLPTLTIGIPAYNEAKNIIRLLSDLLKNDQTTYRLEKIIVLSDGSTDATVRLVKKFAHQIVLLIHTKKRNGVACAQNEIIKKTTSDYLLLLNADIRILDSDFVTAMLSPLLVSPDIGIVSARVVPLPEKTFVEKIVNWSHSTKTAMYEIHPHSMYLCHGRARAFSKKLYSKLVFPKLIADDAYSYLYARQQGLRFAYAKKARVYFRSPSNLHDHILQSQRFFRGKDELTAYFARATLKNAYRLPKHHTVTLWLTSALRHPILAFAYLSITAISIRTIRRYIHLTHDVWKPSESSKNL